MTRTRRALWTLPIVVALAAAGLMLAQRRESTAVRPKGDESDRPADLKPAVSLPISQVILFNSGVGHFTRSGEVDGDVVLFRFNV